MGTLTHYCTSPHVYKRTSVPSSLTPALIPNLPLWSLPLYTYYAEAIMLTALSIEQYSYPCFTLLLYRPPCGGIALDVYNYS